MQLLEDGGGLKRETRRKEAVFVRISEKNAIGQKVLLATRSSSLRFRLKAATLVPSVFQAGNTDHASESEPRDKHSRASDLHPLGVRSKDRALRMTRMRAAKGIYLENYIIQAEKRSFHFHLSGDEARANLLVALTTSR